MSEELKQRAQERGLSKAVLWLYGVGDFGSTTFNSMKSYYWAYFLTTICMFPLSSIAIMTTCTQIVAILLSPIYGAIINGSKAMKWGRYRSWLLIPLPLCIIFCTLAWTNFGGAWAPVWCGLFSILGSIFFNLSYNANLALIGVIAKTPNEHAAMSASRGVYANISVVLWSLMGSPFILFLGKVLGSEAWSYPVASLCYGLLFFICYFVHFVISKPYEGVDEAINELAAEVDAEEAEKKAAKEAKKAMAKADNSRLSAKDMIKSFVANPQLLAIAAPDWARWVMNFTQSAATVYFFTLVLDNAALMATYLLVANILAIVGSMGMKYMVKAFGLKSTATISFFGSAIALILGRLFYTNVVAVMICLCVSKLCFGVIYTVVPALYAEAAVYSEWKTGKAATGWIMGLSNVPLQIATLFINLIITGFLALGKYTPDITAATASIELKTAIANMFMGIEGILLFVTTFVFLFGYKLTAEKMDQCRREIDERNAAAEA